METRKLPKKEMWSRRMSAIKHLRRGEKLETVLVLYPDQSAWIEKNKDLTVLEALDLFDSAIAE